MIWLLAIVLMSISAKDMSSDGARILAAFPFPSKSHSFILNTLTMELARRGHEVVVLTADLAEDNVPPNYKQIYLESAHEIKKQIQLPSMGTTDAWKVLDTFEPFGNEITEAMFSNPEVIELIAPNSTERFDLVLTEWLYWWGTGGLAHRFSAPLIGIATLSLNSYAHHLVGNPLSAAYIPDYNVGYASTMNVWERLVNLYYLLRRNYRLEKQLEAQDAIAKKYLGNDTPHVREIFRNTSLLLSYTDPILFYPQPNVPAIVEIGGMLSVRAKTSNELSPELKKVLDEATDGFIYFSFGSTIPSSGLSDRTRRQFSEAFAALPYKVLWKWENDTLPEKPDNVFVSKWLPQRKVLAHPNLRVFLYQGGLQSTEEAIEFGVPVVGIPLFVDHTVNTKKVESVGMGKGIYVDIESVKKEQLIEALLEVSSNPRYRERARKLRDISNDRPYDALDNAVWWIEYVMRHGGAKHLRVRALDLSWYQLLYLDVLLAALVVLSIVLGLLYASGTYVTRRISKHFRANRRKMRSGKKMI